MTRHHDTPDEATGQASAPRPVRLTSDMSLPALSAVETGSYVLMLGAMWAVLHMRLLGALLAGLLVYQLVHTMAPSIEKHMSSQRARWLSVVLLSVLIVGSLTGLTLGIIQHFENDVPSVQKLLNQAMQLVDQAREQLPEFITTYLPVDTEQMKLKAAELMHAHANQLQQGGKNAARIFTHVLIGMIIGAIIAITGHRHSQRLPLSTALIARISRFADAFRRIVFAQVKISAINATFTGVFLLVLLPLFHAPLPLSKTLVLITFIVGLLPVLGNLISNTLIVAVALSVSFPAAITSLVFLVLIHKLEYFLNARIVGGQIEARTWELLVAMLVMEATFGIPGVIAAPVFYAYIKRELIYLRLV
ncbi:AI-2E family transporter [Paraburkholderia bonniea]|uniref:AI-2E family transporter n=1 Tax=Paraburkholderia bonniea TaxID=2152891 RepID=UPI00129265BD|nr:AI-2E family transporter [Paraburkholderia bonniea]WJF89937.1 AI-2E family transporter [Paraburkholderia bonniea]WJF93251.1 AI-2E family transporter [Paraburkholderia bonniea]